MSEPLQTTMPEPRLIKLPRNGPKPGQSTAAWLHGKNKHCQAERDAAKWILQPSQAKAIND